MTSNNTRAFSPDAGGSAGGEGVRGRSPHGEPGARRALSRWLRRRWSPAGRDSGGQTPSGRRTRCSRGALCLPRACPHEHAVCTCFSCSSYRTPVLLGLGSPSPRVTSPSLTLETSAQRPVPRSGPVRRSSHSNPQEIGRGKAEQEPSEPGPSDKRESRRLSASHRQTCIV